MFYPNQINENDKGPSRKVYPWHLMEEYFPDGGMWADATPTARADLIEAAEALMVDPEAFAAACTRATTQWPLSTSVALTTPGLNKRAWLGHAACFILTGSPEETTRQAWHLLDAGEQYAANDAADTAISAWRVSQTPHHQEGLF